MKCPQLILDANCGKLDKKQVKQMLLDMCEVCEMHPISPAYSVYGAEYNPGISGFIFIEFSNITIHTFERGNIIAINVDVFSCRDLDKRKIIKYLRSKGVFNIKARIIRREIKYD